MLGKGQVCPAGARKGKVENYYDVFSDVLKSPVDKVLFCPAGLEKGPAGQETHAGCPAGLGKRFSQGPTGLELPTGSRIRKKQKIKNKVGGGVICAQKSQHGKVPTGQIVKSLKKYIISITKIIATLKIPLYKKIATWAKS